MAFGKKRKCWLTLLLLGALYLAPAARADTVEMTASCSNTNGATGNPASCNTYSDIKIDGSQLQKVELVSATFDDSGQILITSPTNKQGMIPSSGSGCAQTHAAEDVTSLFPEKGTYTVHVEPKNDCGGTVGASAVFRVTYKETLCSGTNSPKCDTPGSCQRGPGKCVVVNGQETCSYPASAQSCDADGNSCTYDTCVASADGTSASCQAGANICGGLIPCGRLVDDPSTPNINETNDCNFCSLVYMSSNVVNFLMGLVGLITVLFLVVGGLIYVKTSGNVSLITAAKENFARIIQGFIIIFVAWVVVNLLMVVFGFTDPLGDGRWEKFDCKTAPAASSSSASSASSSN